MNSKPEHYILKDHSVSGEKFSLKWNPEHDILITSPQPSKEEMGSYYQSEDYISHTGSKRSLFEIIYHWVRSWAIRKKLTLIEPFKKEQSRLLDVGCGTGEFIEAAIKRQWLVSGVEPNDLARSQAQNKISSEVYRSLDELEPNSSKFQIISMWHVLEHLHDLDTQIKTIRSLLSDSGRLIVAVPNFRSYDSAYYGEFWAAYDVPRHLWHFSREGIKRIFGKHGMEVEAIKPMKFDAYYVSLLSEKYKSGRMNFFKAAITGMRSNLKAKHTGEYSSLIYILKKAENAI